MNDHIADLIGHPKVRETRDHMHHSIAKLDHLMRVVNYTSVLARWFDADLRICLRAALVHDIDSRHGTLTNHGAIAARWAAAEGESPEVCAAIISHMFPLGGPAPTTREGWVLALADKAATFGDFGQFVRGLIGGDSLDERRRLMGTDPFYEPQKVRRALLASLQRMRGR